MNSHSFTSAGLEIAKNSSAALHSAYAHVEQDSGDEQARPKAHLFAPLSPEDLGPTREHEPASLLQLDRLHDLARRYTKYLSTFCQSRFRDSEFPRPTWPFDHSQTSIGNLQKQVGQSAQVSRKRKEGRPRDRLEQSGLHSTKYLHWRFSFS